MSGPQNLCVFTFSYKKVVIQFCCINVHSIFESKSLQSLSDFNDDKETVNNKRGGGDEEGV